MIDRKIAFESYLLFNFTMYCIVCTSVMMNDNLNLTFVVGVYIYIYIQIHRYTHIYRVIKNYTAT